MHSADTVLEAARKLYAGSSGISATLQAIRPHICPFEEILPLVPRGASILDAGCGAGLFLGLLAHFGQIERGLGFDSNARAIELAQTMAAGLKQKVQLDFQCLDATAEWPHGQFDVVSLVDVLHHVPPSFQKDVLSLAASRVRPGGLLLYKDMAERPTWKAMCNRAHDLLVAREWIHYLPFAVAIRHLSDSRMDLVAEHSASRFCYAHEWAVFRRLN